MAPTTSNVNASGDVTDTATEQIARLASTITDLVGVLKDVKQELSDSKSQSKKIAESVEAVQKAITDQKAGVKDPPGRRKVALKLFDEGRTGLEADVYRFVEPSFAFGIPFDESLLYQGRLTTGNGSCPDTDDAFHCFSKLPPELRMKIWKLALPGNRIFTPFFDRDHREHHGRAATNPNGALIAAALALLPGAGPPPLAVNPVVGPPIPAMGNVNLGFPIPNIPLRVDFPTIRLQPPYRPPAVRAACREARRAASEAGAFEFGIFGTSRRGYWFNHAQDIVSIRSDIISSLQDLDLTRVRTVGFLHLHFHEELAVTSLLDVILHYAPRCQQILYCFDPDSRQCRPHIHIGGKTTHHFLRDEDLIGFPLYSVDRGLPDGPVSWGDLRPVIEQVWAEHLTSQGRDPDLAPELIGMDVVRHYSRW